VNNEPSVVGPKDIHQYAFTCESVNPVLQDHELLMDLAYNGQFLVPA